LVGRDPVVATVMMTFSTFHPPLIN